MVRLIKKINTFVAWYIYADPPTIEQPQNSIQIPLKEISVTLQCMASGEGSLKYYWEQKNQEIGLPLKIKGHHHILQKLKDSTGVK